MPVLYVFLLPAFALLFLACGDRRKLPLLAVLAVNLALLGLSPFGGNSCEALRYAAPFIYSAPFLVGYTMLYARPRRSCCVIRNN
jgi:hypothetical protein